MITRRQFVMRGGLLVPMAAGLVTSTQAQTFMANRRTAFRQSNTSPPIMTSLVFFAEAAQESYADNDPVPTITDLSGSGRSATQSTGAKQPTFKTNIVNGRSAYLFDGVDDEVATASASWSGSFSAYVVAKQVSSTVQYARLWEIGANTHAAMTAWTSSATVNGQWVVGASSAATSTGSFRCFSFVGTTGTATLWSNGSSVSTMTGTPGTLSTTLTVGNYGGGGSYYGNWYVATLVIYNTNHGTTDRQSIENWLIARYGL